MPNAPTETPHPPEIALSHLEVASLSPAMRQYVEFKRQHPEYVLFFRMGDFYEMFWDDARLASRVLGISLTSRSKGGLDAADAVPMAGVPFHSVEGYLRKMIAAGHKVAMCEQTEDASEAKGVVKRDVTRLMTPGTLTDDPLLDGRSDNYLAAVSFATTKSDGYRAGLAWVELSTGECRAMSGTEAQAVEEIARLSPAELLMPEMPSGETHPLAGSQTIKASTSVTARAGWQFTARHGLEEMQKQWQVKTAAGYGFSDDDPAVAAVGALLTYLHETQKASLDHLRPPARHLVEDHLSIDPASYRSLEIDRTIRTGGTEGSLLSAIDRTATAMGGRMLRQWLRFPRRRLDVILERQRAVAALVARPTELRALAGSLGDICDVERIVARLTVGRASPRDLAALGKCLAAMPKLIDRLKQLTDGECVAAELLNSEPFCAEQADFLASAVLPDPAAHLREGGVIAQKFHAELDRLKGIATNSQQSLAEYQAKLAGETGIDRLKVGYNKVFGYYIEVTHAHRDKVPDDWTRKQTVKDAERYITPQLKAFEADVLGARDRSIALEQELFEQVRQTLLPHVGAFQELALALGRLDVLSALATLALERRYCRPNVVEERVLNITDGRHPVLEQSLGSEFVANDVSFEADDSLQLITGPNMAGKSTFIRQTALIVLLAQIGSFVPAKAATVGLVDRLFTRIGASDEIHGGQSTFMVEMTETAHLLNNATDRSLVVLDEIGRGTGTLDGLSLAWAIAEHVAINLKCRTLFATHYHELTDLATQFRGVKNLNVSVREWEDQVIFLHRIVEGGTDRSYGIHVARLAGVPGPVIARARQLLGELAVQHVGVKARPHAARRDANQFALFAEPKSEVEAALAAVDLESLTPVAAFDLIRQWKEKYAI